MHQTAWKYLKIITVFIFIFLLGATSLACDNIGSSKDDSYDWYTDTETDSTDWYTDTETETTDWYSDTDTTTTGGTTVTQPGYTSAQPAPVDVSVDKASSSIGKEGGEVILESGATLTVMANALPATTSVSLEQFSNPADFGQDATAFEITGLGGLTGNTELTFPVEEGLTEKEVAVYGYNPETNQYFSVPYVYDTAGKQVAVTISPSMATSAIMPDNHIVRTGLPQYDVHMAIAQDSVISIASQAGIFERLKILVTPEEEYVPEDPEFLVELPFYEQSGGSCWAADTEMIIAGFNPGNQRQHLGQVLSSVKASDDDFGLTAGWINFQEILPRYLSVQTSAAVTWRGFIDTDHLRWRMLQELDAGHPIILELPGIGHYLLVIGYQNSGESFIIHDSRGTSPVDSPAPEGGMYTVRPWSWIEANKGGMVNVVHIMWPEATPAPENLLSLACPGGSENGGGALGQAFFYFLNPKNGRQVPAATLQFQPSSMYGIRWQDRLETVTIIPNTATNFVLSTKVWNAAFQDDSAEVKIQVRRSANVFYTRSLGTFRLPAADYNTTSPVTVTADILTADFRDLSNADASGNLPVSIDVMLMQGSAIMDSFTVEATLNVTPKIDLLNPTSVKPGDVLTITGSCFGKVETANSEVVIDDETMDVVSWSDTQITVQIPQDSELSGDVELTVRTGSQYTYESNVMLLTATSTQEFTLTRKWTVNNTSVDGVLNASFDWGLSGTGDCIVDSETNGEITIKVLPGVPLRLTVNSQGWMQNPQITEAAATEGWTWVTTYKKPQLYDTTADTMLDIGGDFSPSFSCSGGSVNVAFTFSDEFQSLSLTVIYCVYYNESLYDDQGEEQDTKTNQMEWGQVGMVINIEAYEP
jgi:hypothetical protein